MPYRAPKPCAHPGCAELVLHGARCEEHRRDQVRRYDRARGSFRQRGYTREKWDQLRADHLLVEPLCRECLRQGDRRMGSHVDHVVPHRGDDALFTDPLNLQTLCPSHHTQKTATETGRSAEWLRQRYAPDEATRAAIERGPPRRRRGSWFGA